MPEGQWLDRQWLERELLTRLLPGYADDPEAALLRGSEEYAVGPIPLFDPGWYRARRRLKEGRPAFLHYLTSGAAKGCDPHPLFSARHYLRQAPEAVTNPLLHFLAAGGPAGLDCHPLFSSGWYLDQNPDVRAAGMIPIVHYLQWGAAEGRAPNPLFSVAHYVSQTSDPAAKRNPLLHFVLEGEAAGLEPHPSFRPARVRATVAQAATDGALASYLATLGPEQPARAGRLGDQQADPPMVWPSPLALAPREAGAATCDGIEVLRALGIDPPADGGTYCIGKLESVGRSAEMAAEFGAALGRGAGHPITALIAGTGLLPSARPVRPEGDPSTDLLARHAQLRYAAADRFRPDPARAGTAPGGETISILLPVFRTPIPLLERAVLSVLCQTYPDWELCIVDDGSGDPGLAAALARLAGADGRIKLQSPARNGGIAAASNLALAAATGRYAGLLDHDDMLAADALAHVARALDPARPPDLVYTDECMLDLHDVPLRLFPKPDWSPALLTSFMYTGHFSVYRTALLSELGGFRGQFDFAQDYDLALRVAERDPHVVHVREVLYGWRAAAGSAAAGDKPDARTPNLAALQDAADRRGWAGTAVALPMANRLVRRIDPAPLVSIVIPSDDPAHILQTVMSITAHTAYPRYEIIVVARDAAIAGCKGALRARAVRFVPFNAAFNFSAKCNAGAAAATGAFVVFLNDDVRVLTPEWIEAVLEALLLPGVGAAAPKLLYGDNTIQHAGMVTGTRRLVGTAFHCFPHATPAHFNLAQSLREVSLLSGACLAMPTALFRELGGFDAANTPVAHSDVDLCLRVREAGYRCIYTPHAELTHLGHQAIGAAERRAGFRPDKADLFLMRRWGRQIEDDPYFPPAMRDLLLWGDERPFRYHAAPRRGPTLAGDALIVSHDLSGSGAPKIVWDMARVLLASGRQVLVMAPEDGPFRERLLAAGADVVIEPDVLLAGAPTVELARNFDLVICNTILSWRLLPALAPFTRTFLYAHETGLVEQTACEQPDFAEALSAASGLWAGSERAASALRRLGLRPTVVEYGVEAPALRPVDVRGRQVVIATLATIEPRKGQDLAVKAFPLLPEPLRARCRMRLFGRPHDLPFTAAIVALAGAHPQIEVGPELDLDGYRRALAGADIVLCPSRDDTLPIVSLDALAAGKILVVSQDVGTSAYLQDGQSGFVLRHNNPQEIAHTLAQVIAERRRWPEIAGAAQRVFRDHFSQERFARRLLSLLETAAAELAAE